MNRVGWRRQTGGVMDGRFMEEWVLDGGLGTFFKPAIWVLIVHTEI